jgi:hypothetical protein
MSVAQYGTRGTTRIEDRDMANARAALRDSDGQFVRRVLIVGGIAALAALLWMLSEILLVVFASALLAAVSQQGERWMSVGLTHKGARHIARLDPKFLDGFLQGFFGIGGFHGSKPSAGAAKMIDLPVLEGWRLSV